MMLLTCRTCGITFEDRQMVDGKERGLHGRQQCLSCLPYRPRPGARVYRRPIEQKICEGCGKSFPAKVVIDGKLRSLYRRRFCFECSPFGAHNTSRIPPGSLGGDELIEHRRKRRNAKTYRYQKKKRREAKERLVRERGGCCISCGYDRTASALEFHHHDPKTKDFAIGGFNGTWAQILAESLKCDLVCANCHRSRHAAEDVKAKGGSVVEFRRRLKVRAVAYMGGRCFGCGRDGLPSIFDFHHRDAADKSFGIGQDGIPRRWDKVVAELEKCVMLCANCHREVHAGVRELDHDHLLGLAEDAVAYAA